VNAWPYGRLMRRMITRAAVLSAVSATALLLPAGAAQAATDLGWYSSFDSCSSDARSNNELGLVGIFYCAWSPNDGKIHQYYSDAVS